MIVVDASVLANALADDEASGERARQRLLADTDLHAPEIIDLEIASVLRKRLNAGYLDERRAVLTLEDLTEIPLVRYPHWRLLPRIWELRQNLTPYDAAYIALAELLACPLVTADKALQSVTHIRCTVEILI